MARKTDPMTSVLKMFNERLKLSFQCETDEQRAAVAEAEKVIQKIADAFSTRLPHIAKTFPKVRDENDNHNDNDDGFDEDAYNEYLKNNKE